LAAEDSNMSIVALLAIGASAAVVCFFLVSGFLGEGAGVVLTLPVVAFIILTLGVALR
jgi:hypothetical protein